MTLEDPILNEIGQVQKYKYLMFSLICGSKKVDDMEIEYKRSQ
jgi:hypothetical protein